MKDNRTSITLQDIADKAGVSRMTVSLALRNSPRLAKETRERVQRTAREMGYNPNALVSTLMVHLRSRKMPRHVSTLAFVSNYSSRGPAKTQGGMAKDYWNGASDRANQLGYRLEEVWAKEPGMTSRRLGAILLARGIRGLLIGPLPQSRGHLSLDWTKFAAVALGFSMWKPNLHRAGVDHYQCLSLALRQMKRFGYRRVGLAIPQGSDERVDRRFQAAMLVYQQNVRPSDRVPMLLPKTSNEKQFAVWYREHRPDVVLANSSYSLEWLRNCGQRIPQDVGFVHLHWEEAWNPSAGVYHNGGEAAAAAVDMLVGQLQRHEFGLPGHARVVLVNGEWKDGPTARQKTS